MYHKKTSFLVVGGDLRQIHMARKLQSEGFRVTVACSSKEILDDCFIECVTLTEKNTAAVDCIILPVPLSNDGKTLHTPLYDEVIILEDLIRMIPENTRVFGGLISDPIKELFHNAKIDLTDYLQREELALMNAIPTAEGAIEIALREMPITLFGCHVLVTGFGRIAKVLLKQLSALGAHVTICARKCEDLTLSKIMGATPVHLSDLSETLCGYDLIINTVPAMIFTRENLSKIKPGTLVIDLASKPGGIDFEAAKQLSVQVIWALSLPGKVAPVTAGEYISSTILNILEERGCRL